MTIDLTKCTGCGSCMVACKVENNLPLQGPEEILQDRDISWMEILSLSEGQDLRGEKKAHLEEEKGTGRGEIEERRRYLPRPCMHCDDPPCTKVCPVYATMKDRDGIVSQIYDRCIGCRYCTNNCPYTAKFFVWNDPKLPKGMEKGINPDVTVRPKGVVEKCTFCHHRLQRISEQAKTERRSIRDGEFVPACLEVCPTQAILFGDLDDPSTMVARSAGGPRAFRELEDLGTEPKVFYLKEDF
jgi:molybdopterin-containing oxidoreductase family iron-sulfur binding subunit